MAGVQKLTVRTGQERLFTGALHVMRSVGGLFDGDSQLTKVWIHTKIYRNCITTRV